jgi:CRISPR/Cas system CSM-associated protein Csm3 (group 7 of RAMP superfamily)
MNRKERNMDAIGRLDKLPESKRQGLLVMFQIPLKITVQEGSFLHVGGSPSPLTEKKAPVFSVNGAPVIPASSFKGAFRYQVEQLLITQKDELMETLRITDEDLIKPCIPAPRPTKAEEELLKLGYRRHCEIKVDENKVGIPRKGVCPICYFFGATGLMGFLRIPNFWPEAGEFKIDQTSIRIDRRSGTAAHGAIVTGEQVKPGTVFKGAMDIIAKQGSFEFGRPRIIGETKIDCWLDGLASEGVDKVQLLLINEILVPALNNLTVLGGQKSKGAGRVSITIDE